MIHCSNCPRHCPVDRVTTKGFCNAGEMLDVATICRHQGEEPPLVGKKGVCNVFFAHCNLQCVYCQNYQISGASVSSELIHYHTVEEIVDGISAVLPETENILGLVSPTHYADRIPEMLERLHERGLFPTVVYNTNGYDDVDVLRRLEPYVDVYLPDFKYCDASLAARLSHASDYPEKAGKALREMYRQKGSSLITDENDVVVRGMLVRHLVLPGYEDDSVRCLEWIADNLSTNLHISLMSQYYPPQHQKDLLEHLHLDGPVSPLAYQCVVDRFYSLGFHNGWVQELSSSSVYQPDFNQAAPFK